MQVALKDIRIDGGTQPRAAISDDTVREYAESMTEGVALPPVDVFWDGTAFWLADGYHRYFAGKRIGLVNLPATVHNGTKRDAVLFSVGANHKHGLQRTNADKRKAVLTLLGDDEWCGRGQSWIAKQCGVSHTLVGDVSRGVKNRNAKSLVQCTSDTPPPLVNRVVDYTTKHGTEATMEVSKIGRTSRQPKADPAMPTEYETKKAMAIDGAAHGLLKKLPRRADAAQVQAAVHALQGITSVMAQINAADLAEHPDAVRWYRAISDVIGVLRAFVRPLPQAEKKDIA
jgi:hypothetical protein